MTKEEKAAFDKQARTLSGPKLLAFYVSGLVGTINRGVDAIVRSIDAQTKDTGKWASIHNDTLREGLSAIALAASTPDDNSEEVKEQIKALTERAKAVADVLEDAAGK